EAAASDEETDDGATADGDQWCSDVSIAAFPGGGQGTPFTNNVHNGYMAAEADLGPDVTYFFSEWSEEQMVQQFREAMALQPDGMAVMGHPGDAAMGPLIDEAYEDDIQVTVVNVELPESQEEYGPDGTGYVGAPNYDAGMRLAEEAVDRAGAESGDEAFVWGLLSQEGRGQRTQGIVDGFEEAGLEVVYQEIDQATNSDAPAGTPTFTGTMAANPDVSIVVTDHGDLTATAQTYMEAAGLGPDDVYFAGFDLNPASAEALDSGYLDVLIDQQPFLQGYLPILQICLTQVYGFSGLFVDTAGAFIDTDNVDAIRELIDQEIR
ncbi:substrate-binding domain-containing protein, partial [Phytoactinopolyspora endophytica]|uniref:sugar ABC transporter substrate-binding protein n=1 Tax=Phytoactinopolyspora endophytica TaxID=1642495 RepID=UPI00197B4CB6